MTTTLEKGFLHQVGHELVFVPKDGDSVVFVDREAGDPFGFVHVWGTSRNHACGDGFFKGHHASAHCSGNLHLLASQIGHDMIVRDEY